MNFWRISSQSKSRRPLLRRGCARPRDRCDSLRAGHFASGHVRRRGTLPSAADARLLGFQGTQIGGGTESESSVAITAPRFMSPISRGADRLDSWCRSPGSNRDVPCGTEDFKSPASAISPLRRGAGERFSSSVTLLREGAGVSWSGIGASPSCASGSA